jgi:pSer/pThr/pTyr-binding forkhead associated (FHA) protein
MTQLLGTLVPIGGGDPIPLTTEVLSIGRRSSCDICLNFANVSGIHCELSFRGGVWTVRDMGSTNGTKVNGERVLQHALAPGAELDISKHRYKIQYTLPDGAEVEIPAEEEENIFGQSLMEKAGLEKPKKPRGKK